MNQGVTARCICANSQSSQGENCWWQVKTTASIFMLLEGRVAVYQLANRSMRQASAPFRGCSAGRFSSRNMPNCKHLQKTPTMNDCSSRNRTCMYLRCPAKKDTLQHLKIRLGPAHAA